MVLLFSLPRLPGSPFSLARGSSTFTVTLNGFLMTMVYHGGHFWQMELEKIDSRPSVQTGERRHCVLASLITTEVSIMTCIDTLNILTHTHTLHWADGRRVHLVRH